jgi:hypothetical protein
MRRFRQGVLPRSCSAGLIGRPSPGMIGVELRHTRSRRR